MDSAFKSSLMNLPFPMMVLSNKGEVLWYNQNFSLLLKRWNIRRKHKSYIKNFNFKYALEGKRIPSKILILRIIIIIYILTHF